MQPLHVIGLIVAVAILALAGVAAIVVATTAASLSLQSASAANTADVITTTTINVTTQGAIASGGNNNSNYNKNSNANVTLGNLLAVTKGIDETYNAMNDTYAVVSYLDSVTLMPPNVTTTINATEKGNSTVNIQPNGITLVQGQGFLVTQEDGNSKEENATATFVSLGTTNPNGTASRIGVVGTGSRIGVVFYNTNSTGELAFLDNMVGIYEAESSQKRVTSRMWEWKGGGGTLPFETGSSAPITGNQTAINNSAPEEEQTESTMNTTTTNNVLNALLSSRLFSFGEGERTSFNAINDTHTEISVVSNTTIIPPNDTTATTINATEKGNVTFNILPNGVTFAQGQVFLVTQDDDETVQEENATATIVEINRIGPDGIGSATGVAFYKTNSTGQLEFLDNMIGIYQREITPEGSTVRTWEWKGGGTLPFENSIGSGADTAAIRNQTTTTVGVL